MAIDASIPLQLQPPANPLAQYAQLAQLQALQTQGKMADVQLQGAQRAQDRQNKLSQLLSGEYATPDAREQALLRGGFADESLKLGKDRRENTKLQSDTEATQFKTAHEKLSSTLNILASAKDPASYAQAIQAITALGGDVSKAPPQYDPAFVANAGRMVLTEKDRIEQAAKARGLDLTAAAQAETGRHNRATEGIAGGNLAVAREGLGLRKQELASGRIPAGYRAKADGTLEFIPGGPADPDAARKAAPTEFQGKSAGFGTRAQEADRILTELTGKFSPAAVNLKQSTENAPVIGGALGAGVNMMTSAANQKAEQAQRDFVNAVLRQESGAAISASEFENAKKQYFPQPGDGPEVIRQKEDNRKLAVQGFLNNAGRALPKQPAPKAAPNIDALLDKYK